MKWLILDIRRFFAWFAIATYILLGGNAVAGIVTCFGLDGHIATELPHAGEANKAKSGVEFQSAYHGPCIDVSVQLPAKATEGKIFPRSDGGVTPVAVIASSLELPKPVSLRGIVWPAAPPSGGALLDFTETVRLHI